MFWTENQKRLIGQQKRASDAKLPKQPSADEMKKAIAICHCPFCEFGHPNSDKQRLGVGYVCKCIYHLYKAQGLGLYPLRNRVIKITGFEENEEFIIGEIIDPKPIVDSNWLKICKSKRRATNTAFYYCTVRVLYYKVKGSNIKVPAGVIIDYKGVRGVQVIRIHPETGKSCLWYSTDFTVIEGEEDTSSDSDTDNDSSSSHSD
jgi:hypothetical protein